MLRRAIALQDGDADDQIEEAERLYARLCHGGLGEACIRQSAFHVLGIKPFEKRLDRAQEILQAACQRKDKPACAHHWSVLRHRRGEAKPPPSLWDHIPFDRSALVRQCKRHDAGSCALLGLEELAEGHHSAAADLFGVACEGGATYACNPGADAAIEAVNADPSMMGDLMRQSAELAKRSCDENSPGGCFMLAMIREGQAPRTPNKSPYAGSLALLRRACHGDVTAHYLSSLARPMAHESCLMVSDFLREGDSGSRREEAQKARARACRLGSCAGTESDQP